MHVPGRPDLPGDLGRILALGEFSAAQLLRRTDELQVLILRNVQRPP